MSKLTKNERLVLSLITTKNQSNNAMLKQLNKHGFSPSIVELEKIGHKLYDLGHLESDKREGFRWVKPTPAKPSKIKTIISFVLLFHFAMFLLSGPVAVVVWIWQTTFTVAAKYAASYGVFMLTVVWFGFLFKWSEMMQNRYDGSE